MGHRFTRPLSNLPAPAAKGLASKNPGRQPLVRPAAAASKRRHTPVLICLMAGYVPHRQLLLGLDRAGRALVDAQIVDVILVNCLQALDDIRVLIRHVLGLGEISG